MIHDFQVYAFGLEKQKMKTQSIIPLFNEKKMTGFALINGKRIISSFPKLSFKKMRKLEYF